MLFIFLFLLGIPLGLFIAWALISLIIAIIIHGVRDDDVEDFGERWKKTMFFWTIFF